MNTPKLIIYTISALGTLVIANIIRILFFPPRKYKNYFINTELDDQELRDEKQSDHIDRHEPFFVPRKYYDF